MPFNSGLPELSIPEFLRAPFRGSGKRYPAPSNVILAQMLKEKLDRATLPTPSAAPQTPPIAPPQVATPTTAPTAPLQEMQVNALRRGGPTPEPGPAPPTVYAGGAQPPNPGPPAAPPAPVGPPEASPGGGSGSIWDNPEALEQILAMEGVNRKLSYAEALRGLATPEGRYTGGGRMYTAASPIEHLATGLARWKGRKDVDKYSGELSESRKKLLEFLRK